MERILTIALGVVAFFSSLVGGMGAATGSAVEVIRQEESEEEAVGHLVGETPSALAG